MIQIFLLLTVAVLHVSSQGCASGWTEFQKWCYYANRDNLVWSAAEDACKKSNARLVAIDSEAEDTFLVSLFKGTKWTAIWTGGYRNKEANQFQWVPCSEPFGAHQFWGKGQPDNLKNNENCVEKRAVQNYTWNDKDCATPLFSVCEKKVGK